MKLLARKKFEQWYKEQDEMNKKLEEETAERIRANKEFIKSLPPEKLRQYRIMKVVFIVFMLGFYLAALITYSMGWRTLVSTLFVELGLTLISVVFWKDPPKWISFPRVFAMPVLAFVLTVVAIGSFFLLDTLSGKFSAEVQSPMQVTVQKDDSDILEDSSQLMMQEESEYEIWLRENNIIEDEQGGY